jgi:hypothetical protein
VTAVFVAGVAVIVGVAPAVVPVSVTVTVITQFVVVPLEVYVNGLLLPATKPGQLPEKIVHA